MRRFKRSSIQEFTIMNAACLFDNKAAPVEGAVDTWGKNITVLVCKRERSFDTYSRIFVCGSGASGYDMHPGDNALYVQDTGNGYGARGNLIIENVITFDEDGKMTAANDVGLKEKRRHWTMK